MGFTSSTPQPQKQPGPTRKYSAAGVAIGFFTGLGIGVLLAPTLVWPFMSRKEAY